MVTVNDRDGINMEKEITVIDWQSGSFHIWSNEGDLWEAAAVEAINANHMHSELYNAMWMSNPFHQACLYPERIFYCHAD